MGKNSLKILLVDDNLAILKIHELKLGLDGYQVVTAKDGQEGLQKARSEHPQLIILDLQMPNVDGFEMLGELNKDSKLQGITSIVLSDFDQLAVIEKCLNLGANEYLVKSQVTPEEVSTVVERLIGKFKIN